MSTAIKFRQFIKIKHFQLFNYQRRTRDGLSDKANIKRQIKLLNQTSSAKKDIAYLNSSKNFLRENFLGYKNTNWHHYYSALNGIKNIQYISDDLFFNQILPTLNNYELSDATSDKISFDLFFNRTDLPVTKYRMINGRFYDIEYNLTDLLEALRLLSSIDEFLVIKPAIINGCGKNVFIDTGKNITIEIQNNPKYLKGSFIIQENVKQHPEMAKFHPESLNTCRVMTARVGSEIVVLSAYMRIGLGDTRIDNLSKGGIGCGINNDGYISEFAIDQEKIAHYYEHPNTNLKFDGFKVPNYSCVKDFCIKNHKKFLRFTFISWDIGIRENGDPVFIEFNLRRPSVSFHQFFHGPLFGEHTDYFAKLYREIKQNNGNSMLY